jgi:hypothetical protein
MQPVEKTSVSAAVTTEETGDQTRGCGLNFAGQHEDFDSLMNSMDHNSRPALDEPHSRFPASSQVSQAVRTSPRPANPAKSEGPTTATPNQQATQASASPAAASLPADNGAPGSDAHTTVLALALLMPMAFHGPLFLTSDDGRADNAATDSHDASSSSANSGALPDAAAISSACQALSDPAGWLAAKLSASSAALAPAISATGAVAGQQDGITVAATSTSLTSAKDSPAAGSPLQLPTATSATDASSAPNLAASLAPATAEAQPTKAEAPAVPNKPFAHEATTHSAATSEKMSTPAPADSSNSITSPKELARLSIPTPESRSSTTSLAPSVSGTSGDTGSLVPKEIIAQSNSGTSLTNPTDDSSNPADDLIDAALNAGTGVASMDLSMKNPLEENKVAGSSMKLLPVEGSGDAAEQILPPPWVVTGARSADTGADVNLGFSSGDHTSTEDTASVLNSLDLPSLADARMRALDRTQDMVALHGMRLVESKMDALSVVIKPAIGTELSLDLRQQADGVEAHATLLRGDPQFLREQWSNLQERLEQRGIKLADLNYGPNMYANDQQQSQPRQTTEEEVAQQASAFAEFAASSQAGGATARLASVHDGWESWA